MRCAVGVQRQQHAALRLMIEKESVIFFSFLTRVYARAGVYIQTHIARRNVSEVFIERGTIIDERDKDSEREKERKKETTKPGGESQAMSPLWHAPRRRACK